MHYGWIIVIACLVIGVGGYGTYYSFTLFYMHLVNEFGWSRSAISGAMTVGLATYGLFSLPMGWCADHFGPRITVIVGGILFSTGTALGAYINEIWHLYALYGGLSAIGMGAVWSPLVSTVSKWFHSSKRGLAIGIAVLGSGSGIFFIAPFSELLIIQLGWRSAYLGLGLISGLMIIGSALFLVGDPAEKGLKPFGASDEDDLEEVSSTPHRSEIETYEGINKIALTPLFWEMSLNFGLWWFASAIVYIQIGPYLFERGFDSSYAAFLVTLFGGGNCLGRVFMGKLCDLIGGQKTYRLSLGIGMISIMLLGFLEGNLSVSGVVLVLGFGIGGASTQITTISIELFGTKAAGALMGAVLAIIGIIGAGGPLVSGLIRDTTSSYSPAFYFGAAIFLTAILHSFYFSRDRGS